MKKTGIGIVGCGAISGIYLKNIAEMYEDIEVVHVCDAIEERAREAAEKWGIPNYCSDMNELVNNPNVDIVLNLGRTYDHFGISTAAMKAGKHVYSEKPLGITMEEGKALSALSDSTGLELCCSPDTYLGGSFQTCRKLIDDGVIGDVIGGSCAMVCHGHESWHANPDFYYKPGGGPMLDMGPYYITVLVNMLGRVKRVTGMCKKTFDTRTITSQPHYGDTIDVEVDTYVDGLLEFENGAIVHLFTTFDVYDSAQPNMELYGTKGTLRLPDPDWFSGDIFLYTPESKEYEAVPTDFPFEGNCRGLGLNDMAKAIEEGRKPRTDKMQALHVLEVMLAIIRSGNEGRFIDITTPYERAPIMER